MTDFSAVLLRSLKKRDLWNPAERQRVYTQARMAMLRKIWSLQPPLSQAEIDDKVFRFDAAAARIEAEVDASLRRRLAAPATMDEPPQRQQVPIQAAPAQPPRAAPTPAGRAPLIVPRAAQARPAAPAAPARAPLTVPSRSPSAPGAAPRTATPAVTPPRPGTSPSSFAPRPAAPAATAAAPVRASAEPAPPSRTAPSPPDRPVAGRPATQTRLEPRFVAPAPPKAPERAPPRPLADTRFPEDDSANPYAPRATGPERKRVLPKLQRSGQRPAIPEVVPEPPTPAHVQRVDAYLRGVGSGGEEQPTRPAKTPPRKRGFGVSHIVTGSLAAVALAVFGWAFTVFYPLLFPTETALVGGEDEPVAEATVAAVNTATRSILTPNDVVGAGVTEPSLSIAESITLFDGHDPTVFSSASENPIRFVGDVNGGFARVSSTPASSGARAVIGPGLAQTLSGHTVRISVGARSPSEQGAATLRFAYQAGTERSPWKTVLLSNDFISSELIWRVPASAGRDGHAIVVEPLPGDGTGADLSAITIDVLAP